MVMQMNNDRMTNNPFVKNLEILMVTKDFDDCINRLKGYKMTLIDFRNTMIDYDDNLKEYWSGVSCEAFEMSSHMLEAEYNGLINALNDEIEQINNFKKEYIQLDLKIGNQMECTGIN